MDTFWSPQAITGYRIWGVFRDRIEGLLSVWPEPGFEASCTLADPPTSSPHVGELCKCGVYAAKEPNWLAAEFAGADRPQVAIGRVALSGRVIEHTDGYRAQRADVVELAVRTRQGVYHFTEPEDIDAMFHDPHSTLRAHQPLPNTGRLIDLITEETEWT